MLIIRVDVRDALLSLSPCARARFLLFQCIRFQGVEEKQKQKTKKKKPR